MAVKIRLRRMGTKKVPFYRVVVAEARSRRDGDACRRLNDLRHDHHKRKESEGDRQRWTDAK